MAKIHSIFVNLIPILIMIGLIPLVKNDYILISIYICIIFVSFLVKRNKNDLVLFSFGFVIMIFFEYLFISTGVETFNRNSLLGIMPLWLPLLWGYGFVAIKRGIEIIS